MEKQGLRRGNGRVGFITTGMEKQGLSRGKGRVGLGETKCVGRV